MGDVKLFSSDNFETFWERLKRNFLDTYILSKDLYIHPTYHYSNTEYNEMVVNEYGHVIYGKSLKTLEQYGIESIEADKITGTIPLRNLPQGAIERKIEVSTEEERLALTNDKVQEGDIIKVTETNKLYFVTSNGHDPYTMTNAAYVAWTNITDLPEKYTPDKHSHTVANIKSFPSSLGNPNDIRFQFDGEFINYYNGSYEYSYPTGRYALNGMWFNRIDYDLTGCVPVSIGRSVHILGKGNTEEYPYHLTYTNGVEKELSPIPVYTESYKAVLGGDGYIHIFCTDNTNRHVICDDDYSTYTIIPSIGKHTIIISNGNTIYLFGLGYKSFTNKYAISTNNGSTWAIYDMPDYSNGITYGVSCGDEIHLMGPHITPTHIIFKNGVFTKARRTPHQFNGVGAVSYKDHVYIIGILNNRPKAYQWIDDRWIAVNMDTTNFISNASITILGNTVYAFGARSFKTTIAEYTFDSKIHHSNITIELETEDIAPEMTIEEVDAMMGIL